MWKGPQNKFVCVTDHIWRVKCTLVETLRLSKGRTVQRGSRGIALPCHGHGTRRWWRVGVTPRTLFTPGKEPVPIVQKTGRAPGPVWTGAENLAPSGFHPRGIQPIVSRYTDYATRPTWQHIDSLRIAMFFVCGVAFPEDDGGGLHRIISESYLLCKYFLNCYMSMVLDEYLDNNLSLKTIIFINWCEDVKYWQSPYGDFLWNFCNMGLFL